MIHLPLNKQLIKIEKKLNRWKNDYIYCRPNHTTKSKVNREILEYSSMTSMGEINY